MALFLVAVPAATRAGRYWKVVDASPIVIDEVVGYLVAMAFFPWSWGTAIAGFVLFRLFDVMKPWPASALDRVKTGLGVVLDDVAAGVYAGLRAGLPPARAHPPPRLHRRHPLVVHGAHAVTEPDPSPLHVEILATGDELLTGQIVDTNSVWLMDRLWDLGVMARRKTLVADDREDLAAALRETTSRSDLVVMSGGLGPTEDDLTAEVVAAAMGVPLELHAALARGHPGALPEARAGDDPEQRQAGPLPPGRDGGPEPVRHRAGLLGAARPGRARGPPRRAGGVPGALARSSSSPASPPAWEPTPAFRLVKLFAVPESHADQAMRPIMDDPANRGVRFGYRAHWPEIHVKWA